MTNGAGFHILFKNAFTNGVTGNESGRITNYFSNAVSGSQSSAFGFHLVNNAVSARKALLASTGQWTWDGYPALPAQADTTTYKPVAIDGSGNVVKMAGWTGGGATLDRVGNRSYWLSKRGCISDAELYQGSLVFGTDNTDSIQAVLDIASDGEPITVYWDGKYSVTGLLLYSNTTIIVTNQDYGAILRNNSDQRIFTNAHVSFSPQLYLDSNINILGGTWNGNGFNSSLNPAQMSSSAAYGLVTGFGFYGVRNVIIRDINMWRSRTYAIHGVNVNNVSVERFNIDAGDGATINSDGLDFFGGSSNIVVRDGIIKTVDDGVAFNADRGRGTEADSQDYTFYTDTTGPITDCLVDNVMFNNSTFGVRITSGASRVDRITFRNLKGSTAGYWCIIDNYWQDPTGITVAGPGNVGTVLFEDININISEEGPVFVNRTYANINCNVENIIFNNYTRNDFTINNYPSLLLSGNHAMGRITLNGYASLDSGTVITPHINIDGASVGTLTINNATLIRANAINASPLVNIETGSVNRLILNGVNATNQLNIVYNQDSLNYISATNIVHDKCDSTYATFHTEDTVRDIALSNYYGFKISTGTYLKQRGDGFISDLPDFEGCSPIVDTILYNTFTAANGTAIASVASEVGANFANSIGTWEVQNNKAVAATFSGSAAAAIVELGETDYTISTTLSCTDIATGHPIIQCRLTDANNQVSALMTGGNLIELYNVVAGVPTLFASQSITYSNSVDFTIDIILNGNIITVRKDGSTVISGATIPTTQTGTKMTIYSDNTTTPGMIRFNDVLVTN